MTEAKKEQFITELKLMMNVIMEMVNEIDCDDHISIDVTASRYPYKGDMHTHGRIAFFNDGHETTCTDVYHWNIDKLPEVFDEFLL